MLGDVTAIRNGSGNVVARYKYDAWGNIIDQDGEMAEINPFRYRGYYYDTETGFYYLQTRYYDPTICRFINADNYELVAQLSSVPGQLNMYAYCGNNPVMGYDPTGTLDWATFWQGVGMGVTALAAIVLAATTFGAGIPLAMGIVAGITLGAGVLTGVNAVATMIEAGTNYNFIRDGLFQGNSTAYHWYVGITNGIATIGSMALGFYHTTGQYQAAKYGQNFLGKGYRHIAGNRWVSKDGLRQMIFDNTHHILDGVRTTNHYNLLMHSNSIFAGRSSIIDKLHVFYSLFRIWFR